MTIGWISTPLEIILNSDGQMDGKMDPIVSKQPKSLRVLELWAVAIIQSMTVRLVLAPNLPGFLQRQQPIRDGFILLVAIIFQFFEQLDYILRTQSTGRRLHDYYSGGTSCTIIGLAGAEVATCGEGDVPRACVDDAICSLLLARHLVGTMIVLVSIMLCSIVRNVLLARVLRGNFTGKVNLAAKSEKVKARHVKALLTALRVPKKASEPRDSNHENVAERLKCRIRHNKHKGVDDLSYLPSLVFIAHLLSGLAIFSFALYFCFMGPEWAKQAKSLAAEAEIARVTLSSTEEFAANSGVYTQQLEIQIAQVRSAVISPGNSQKYDLRKSDSSPLCFSDNSRLCLRPIQLLTSVSTSHLCSLVSSLLGSVYPEPAGYR
jgi:hypothetical protein